MLFEPASTLNTGNVTDEMTSRVGQDLTPEVELRRGSPDTEASRRRHAASSGSIPESSRESWPNARTSASTPSSTVARSRPASPSPTASGRRLCATWASSPRSSTARAWRPWRVGTSLGHVRYSTTGSASWENAQPEFGGRGDVNVAVADNGNLVNAARWGTVRRGRLQFDSTSDTTFIAAAAVRELEQGRSVGEAVRQAMRSFEGAYSVAMIFRDKLVAFRDPHGFRLLSPSARWMAVTLAPARPRAGHHRRRVPARGLPRPGHRHRRRGLTSYRAKSRCPAPSSRVRPFARPDGRFEGREVVGVETGWASRSRRKTRSRATS